MSKQPKENICHNKDCWHFKPHFIDNCELHLCLDDCDMAINHYPLCLRIRRVIVWLNKYSLTIALILTTLALIIYLAICSWLAITSEHNIAIMKERQAYFDQINKESNSMSERAWKRLWIYHGRPAAVIYEPGKTPWYINKVGQRCKFV